MNALSPVTAGVRGVGTGNWLIWRALRAMTTDLVAGDPIATRALARALGDFLWMPLVRLMPLAALVGIIAGIAAARVLALWNAELLVIGATVDTMLRHVLPIVIGVFGSGSVSVEIASRLGAMSFANEIDAMEAMGRDPVGYVLAPPTTAILIAAPVHMLGAALAALLGAGMPLNLMANVSWPLLTGYAFSNGAAVGVLVGMAKAWLFAVIALGVGAAVGSRPVRHPSEIGQRAGTAFSLGLLGIFAAAAVWTALG